MKRSFQILDSESKVPKFNESLYLHNDSSLEEIRTFAKNSVLKNEFPKLKDGTNTYNRCGEPFVREMISLLLEKSKSKLELQQSHEDGLSHDCVLVKDNKQVGIQIKTTRGRKGYHEHYVFGDIKAYHGMIMIFVSITDGKIWICKYEDLDGRKQITINPSLITHIQLTFMKFEVSFPNLVEKLEHLFDMTIDADLQSYCAASSIKTEHIGRSFLRDSIVDKSIVWSKYHRENATIDGYLSIGDHKFTIQEKTIGADNRGSGYRVRICHNVDGKKAQPYSNGDFDLLILYNFMHPFLEEKAYFIPSHVLEEQKILKTESCPGKKMILVFPMPQKLYLGKYKKTRNEFAEKYLFELRDPDLSKKILAACNKNDITLEKEGKKEECISD